MTNFEQTAEAIILVKAAPQFGKQHGETVCCAGVNLQGEWVRLYPVSFRTLEEGRRFRRWDRIRFKWRKPPNDPRPESLRVDHQSIEIVGDLKVKERLSFLSRLEVTSIEAVKAQGRTLALLRPRNPRFFVEKKPEDEFSEEKARNARFAAQADLFNASAIVPYAPCPYRFKYTYETDDGERTGTCQDWETDATFYNHSHQYGEKAALAYMQRVFGEEYPRKGMAFAMGTHSLYPETWLINGVVRLDENTQMALGL